MTASGPMSAIVTGGGSGIGKAVAQMLAERRYGLSLVGRSKDRLADALSQFDAGADVQTVAIDVAEPEAGSVIVQRHLARFGGVDVLVASAGQTRRATVADTSPDALRRLLAVNVESTFGLVSAALPALRRTGPQPSWVVLISSMVAHWPSGAYAAYSATKAALASLARSIAEEEWQNGVRACALCPGFVDTELSAPLASVVDPSSMIAPQDIAAAVQFLLTLSGTATVTELTISRLGSGPGRP